MNNIPDEDLTNSTLNGTRWLGQWFGCVASCPAAYTSTDSFAFPSTTVASAVGAVIALLAALRIGLRMNDVRVYDDLGTTNGPTRMSTAVPNHPWVVYLLAVFLQFGLQSASLAFAFYSGGDALAQDISTAVWVLHGASCCALTIALHVHSTRYGRRPTYTAGLINNSETFHDSLLLRARSVCFSPTGAFGGLFAVYLILGIHNEAVGGAMGGVGTDTCATAISQTRTAYWLFMMAIILQRVPVYTIALSLVNDKDVSGGHESGPRRKECYLLGMSLLLELPCVLPNSLWSDVVARKLTRDVPCPLGIASPYDVVLLLLAGSVACRFYFVKGEFRRNRESVLMALYQQCNETLDQARHY